MKLLVALPLVVGVVSLAAACSSSPPRTIFDDGTGEGGVVTGDGGGSTTDGGTTFEFDGNLPDSAVKDECKKMDVVFVVDDSGSMAGAQAKLRANFPRMVDTLNAFKTKSGADLDYRLAVTSTDTTRASLTNGGRGGFVTAPATNCVAGGSGRAWLERTDANVANAFGCRAGLGINGSTIEKPLDALTLALGDRAADQNKDFVREDALLAFFILTDEEDSSTATAQSVIQKLDLVKKVRGRWAGALISGQKSGSCSTTDHSAVQAPKLHQLVEGAADPATGKNNVIWRTICQENYDTAVKDALDTFTIACLNLPPLPK
jgi:hypothetical protein